MMELRKLTDEQLEKSFHHVVKSERKIIHLVILHIQEIHRRKLYLAPAYGSLAQYLIKVFKYSGAAAQRRIEAARLMNDVPEIAAKLQSGELNLSQVCELQKAVKESEKFHQIKVSKDVKADLVQQVLNQNTSQTQQLCAKLLDIPVHEAQKIKTQRDKSKRIETTFTEEQFAKFEKVRDLLAHKNFQKKRTQNINDVLETVFDEILTKHSKIAEGKSQRQDARVEVSHKSSVTKLDFLIAANATTGFNASAELQRDPISEVHRNTASEAHRNTASVTECETEAEVETTQSVISASKAATEAKGVIEAKASSAKVPLSTKWKTLTPKRHRLILSEDECCQYTDYESGRICGSTFDLHVDHIIPKHVGGSNDPSNLRVLCREHNLYRQRQLSSEICGRNFELN